MLSDNQVVTGMDEEFSSPSPATTEDKSRGLSFFCCILLCDLLSMRFLLITVCASCKPSREPMCPGAMSGGVRGARWTQIDAIARPDVPWRSVEWRLP